ncbi:MAG: hypothetical protein ACYDDO_07780 [Acidiferrobacterales bacterium]
MKGLGDIGMSTGIKQPAQTLFGAKDLAAVRPEIPQSHSCQPAAKQVAGAEVEKTEGFFRDHPDALLEALLAETAIEFGDPKGN